MATGSKEFDLIRGVQAKGVLVRDLQAITSSTVSRRKLLIGSGAVAGAAAIGTLRIPVATAQDAVEITFGAITRSGKIRPYSLMEAFAAANPDVHDRADIDSLVRTIRPSCKPDWQQKTVSDILVLLEGDIYGKYGHRGELPCIDLTGSSRHHAADRFSAVSRSSTMGNPTEYRWPPTPSAWQFKNPFWLTTV